MIFYRISTGKSTHVHAQWYNSVSVGNSLAAVAMPVYGRAPIHSQVYNGIQQYHWLCTKLLSVGNSLATRVFFSVYGSAHIHVVLYRVPARILSL